jgi:hypothetical protein
MIVIIQLPRCKRWLEESCIKEFDEMNCEAAFNFCSTELEYPFFATGETVLLLRYSTSGR